MCVRVLHGCERERERETERERERELCVTGGGHLLMALWTSHGPHAQTSWHILCAQHALWKQHGRAWLETISEC